MTQPQKDFPVSKVELHQWANTLLLFGLTITGAIIAYIGDKTYSIIAGDHEKIAEHETRITVLERMGEKENKKKDCEYPIHPADLPKKIAEIIFDKGENNKE